MSFLSALVKIFNGNDIYTNSEKVDGELRETFAADIRGHNVCIVRYNKNDNDVNMWVDRAHKHGTIEDVNSFVNNRI